MDLFSALGNDISREFAARKDTLPHAYFYEPGAAGQLANVLLEEAGGQTVLVLFDERTREAAGKELANALQRRKASVAELLIPDGPGRAHPVCDDVTMERLKPKLPRAAVYVAVGSGVVNDLTKWLAADASVPYAVLATAASMNGYTAANVAPAIKGVKSLVRAKAPIAVAAIPRVIEQAPFELTSSGLGDVIAKPVSTADWLINHRLFGEAYSRAVAGIIDAVEPKYLENPEGIARREPAAVRALFEALVFSGCAMTLQGSSLPASGGEHLVSHALDMMSLLDGTGHDLHGRQVGVATIFVAALYKRIMAMERPTFRPEGVAFDRASWGGIADAVEAEFEKKHERMVQACQLLSEPGRWDALRAEVSPILRDPATIKSCLKSSGAAHRIEDLGCSRERFMKALRHCAAIRGRFTSIDLGYAVGLLPGDADEIVDEWLV